jgi:transposase
MEHIAIDLGSRESQICVRAGDGEIVEERRVGTRSLGSFLGKRAPGRVVLETCSEAFAVAEAAKKAGHDVVVVPAMLVRSLGVGQRGIKTDERDSRNLSEASCRMSKLPRVHVPSARSQQMKALCTVRETLISTRTGLINTARAWVRTQGLGVVHGKNADTFGRRLREHVKARDGEIPAYLERLLKLIDETTVAIDGADEEVAEVAKEHPTCRLLMTAPGVGPIVSARFTAAIDDPSRFGDAHRLMSYLGLTPGEASSSDRKRRTGLTKAGPARVRWALVQAAWIARRYYKDDPLVQWSLRVEQKRGRKIAVVALARRLAGVLYAMWRDGREYDPTLRDPRDPSAPV